jgi:STE24 endopeptidase
MAATARVLAALTLILAVMAPAAAQDLPPVAAPTHHVTVYPLPPPGLDNFSVDKAVNAYIASVSTKEKAKSDAYFEGKYYLSVIDLIYVLVVSGVLLWTQVSAWMRGIAASVTRSRILQTPIYVAQYFAAVTVVELPLAFYEGYVREHAYGLSNQSFGAWVGQYFIGAVVSLVALTVLLTLIYAVIRKAKERWWLWGAAIAVLFAAFMLAVQPVLVEPLFNRFQPLPSGPLKTEILTQAKANGVPADNVFVYDESRQSNRITAYVSGFLGSARISLSDNLVKNCPPNEVLAVVGHEIGHYTMNHITILLTWMGLLVLALFWLIDKVFRGLVNLFGGNWDVRTIADPAGLPLVAALIAFFAFLAAPVTNTILRTQETQADIFSLNAVRQPDAFAKATLRLSNYRKLDPSPTEEFWFYDHPSGRTRITTAMRWKAAHIQDPDIQSGPMSP